VTAGINWWRIIHKLMNDLQWTPEQIGRLTWTQVGCLFNERPPGEQKPIQSAEEYAIVAQADQAALEEWNGAKAGGR
jgi:hypothetical protein